jgi:hypothetical protein
MRRILIVANQTATGEHLHAKVREYMESGPCEFHLVVPATPIASGSHRLVWTEGESRALAAVRLLEGLEYLRVTGARVTGQVGDRWPLDAIADALISQRFDEIVVSTLPPGMSKWLAQDLPQKVHRRFGLPVTHVVGPGKPVVAKANGRPVVSLAEVVQSAQPTRRRRRWLFRV